MRLERVLGYLGAALAVVWAALHLFLASQLFKLSVPALHIYADFFVLTSVLALVSAWVFAANVRKLYFLTLVFYIIDTILVTETRVGPAPFFGHPLPVNVYVVETWILDALLVAVSATIWVTSRGTPKETKEKVVEKAEK